MTSGNYEGATLHRRSFRDQDLDHAQFHDADIAGADFTGADLHAADLREVHTGMPCSAAWERASSRSGSWGSWPSRPSRVAAEAHSPPRTLGGM